jgi:hypothetical protein
VSQSQRSPEALTRVRSAYAVLIASGIVPVEMTLDLSPAHAALTTTPEGGRVPISSRLLVAALPRRVQMRGVIDVAARRAMAVRPGIGWMQIDDRVWSGRPGRVLRADDAEAAENAALAPVALLAALGETRAAWPADPGTDTGEVVDAAIGDGAFARLWLRGDRMLRLELRRDGAVVTVVIREGAVDASSLDWTRLPEHDPTSAPA